MKKVHKIHLAVVTSVFMISGCATQNKSVGMGAGIGALGGVAIGGIADPGKDGEYRTRNVIIGATLGTMAGAVTGSVLHKRMGEEKAKAYESGKKSPPPSNDNAPPKLTDPKIEARFVEGKAQGNRYIGPHWEYVLVEPARWTESQ